MQNIADLILRKINGEDVKEKLHAASRASRAAADVAYAADAADAYQAQSNKLIELLRCTIT